MKQKLFKATSALLAVLMLFSIFGTTISCAVNELMTEDELENQEINAGNGIEFNVSAEDGKHSITANLASTETKLSIRVNAKNAGHLENAVVDFSNTNFKVTQVDKPELVNDLADKQITLSKINGGDDVEIKATIVPDIQEKVASDFFNKDNEIAFTAKFFDENEKENSIEKDVVVHVSWTVPEVKASISQEIAKYIQITSENIQGILVQENLSTTVENNILPIKTSQIEINVPRIENELPTRVSVIANSVDCSNGKIEEFNETNWSYSNETGMLTINLSNTPDSDGKISWIKNATDSFSIIYLYSKEALDKVTVNGVSLSVTARVNDTFYSSEDNTSQIEDVKNGILTEQFGNIVDLKAQIIEESINKGYLYTNIIAADGNKNETIFNEVYSLSVSDAEVTSNITIEQGNEVLFDGERKIVENNFTNKSLSVNLEQMKTLLGEDGKLQITSNDETVAEINKESELDDNGNVIVDLSNTNGNIKIVISKPVKAEKLDINIKRAIKKDLEYDKDLVKTFGAIQTNTGISQENGIPVSKSEDAATLAEPTSKSSIELSKNSFSTISNNNEIEIRTVLETNSNDDLLYKNPVLLVKLPSYINSIEITNCSVLYTNELTKASEEIIDTEEGKVIRIKLSGEQTVYNSDIERGVTVVLNANFTVDKLTPSKTDEIVFIYSNELDNESNEIKEEVEFIAPTGVVTVNELENYAEDKEDISLISGEEGNNKAFLAAHSNESLSKFKGQIINNYRNSISDAKIVGVIPNTERQGNSFNTFLKGKINVEGEAATVYYTSNANPNIDLNNPENGWTTAVTDYTKVKAYLIIPNEDMEQGASIAFDMPISIPSNLSFNNQDELNYAVSYKNNTLAGVMAETATGNNITLTTGSGPVLEVSLNTKDSNITTVKQAGQVQFVATVKNTGADATNVKLVIDRTNGNVQKLDEVFFAFENASNVFEIGDLAAGQERTFEYLYGVNANVQPGNVDFKVSATADRITTPIEGTKSLTVQEGDVQIINVHANNTNTNNLKAGETARFAAVVKNTTTHDLNNIKVYYKINSGLIIDRAGTTTSIQNASLSPEGTTINSDKTIASYTIDKLEKDKYIVLRVEGTVLNNSQKAETISYAEIPNNGITYSNIYTKNINQTNITMTASAPADGSEVLEHKDIVYSYLLENTGDTELTGNLFKFTVPNGAKFKSAEIRYIKNGEVVPRTVTSAQSENVNIPFIYTIKPGEKVAVVVTLTTNVLTDEEISATQDSVKKELKMSLTYSSDLINETTSDPIQYLLKYDEARHNELLGIYPPEHTEKPNQPEQPEQPDQPDQPDQPEQQDQPTTYTISGKVWLDENKNDKQDTDEKGISGINVMLIDVATMDFVKDSENKNITVKTAADGTYSFTNLKQGKYMVSFDYANTEYNISQYQVENVPSTINSDAIEKTIFIDNVQKIVGLTDTLQITDSNIRNIDLGLSKSSKFDLQLTKRVKRITVNNEQGITESNYTDSPRQLGKIEIKDQYVASSTVIVEYVITVTNKGDVIGYAKNIVDYIPDELKFNAEQNKDWYLGKDGNAYNISLKDVGIKPGESKEVTIILSKKMTEDNLGLVNNDAEIYEAYNAEGIKNYEVEPGNKNKSEGDMDSAGLITSLKTGETVAKYTTIIIAFIAIVTLGIYMIKVKVLDKRI